MSLAFQRNQQDVLINPATFALPTTLLVAGATYSASIDLGTGDHKPENMEVCLEVPALSATIAPAAATDGVTYEIVCSSSSTHATIDRTIVSKTVAGSASGIAAQEVRGRVPSDCARYLFARVYLSTTCTDASAVAGTFTARF